MAIQKITSCLWFDTQAEDAAKFYTSIFPNSKIGKTSRYGEGGPGPAGSVMTIEFELDGQKFLGLNGGPIFTFTEAISFIVSCETQDEIDRYWTRLTADGGAPVQCGWLKDKFGLSWQIVPTVLAELVGSGDGARAGRVMGALMKMVKLDIAGLKAAAAS